MIQLEADEFGYKNGIYAGDLFVTKDGRLVQRDWNIRRGGRSSPESLIIFGAPNYETKVILNLRNLGIDDTMNDGELLRIYTQICDYLSKNYDIYIISSAFGCCCKNKINGDHLKFNVLADPKYLIHVDNHEEKHQLIKCKHRNKVAELINNIAVRILASDVVEN